MKEYEIEIKNKNTGILYHANAFGETLSDAIPHADYWNAEGDKISTDYTIEEIISEKEIDYYPYTYEDAFSIAIQHKLAVVHAILHQDNVADFDKIDLIRVITNETPSEYIHLDTACRDILPDIVNQYICADMFQLIMEWTEPYMDMTEENATELMCEMEANGFILPIGFTPKDFIEIYHECEQEGDD